MVSFCSSHLAIKNCYNVHFMKIEKIDAKSIFPQKIQKSLIITTKTCTQVHIFKCIYLDGENDSKDAVKTKNAPFFMIYTNITFFHMISSEWPGPLNYK